MKKVFSIFLSVLCLTAFGQKKSPTKKAEPIVEEGKRLYKSEMASWYGTDLFLENYKNQDNIGGYFSYTQDEVSKCIFFSKSDAPKVIGTISFDSTFNTKTALLDLHKRDFTSNEMDLFEIRKKALIEIQTDTLFKTYENTNLNLIPLIHNKKKKVYVLTGPQQNGVVIFGNDYLISFNRKNKVTKKKQLHRNILPFYYGSDEKDGNVVETTIHSHLPETGDFITATDICTLMLYAKYANWKKHNVVSKKYLNLWNCETNSLIVVSMDAINDMSKD